MTRFREVHGWAPAQPGEAFRPHVTAGNWPFHRPLSWGPFDAWFVIHFHNATEITTPHGPVSMGPETVMVFPPRARFKAQGAGRFAKQTLLRAVGHSLPLWLEEAALVPWVPYPLGIARASQHWVQTLQAEWSRGDRDPVLSGMILRCWLREIRRSRGPVPRTRDELLSLGRARLATADGINIEAVARELGYTRRHFTQAFSKTYDVTPKDFVLTHRLARAKEMLQGSPMTVTQVARACGFDDPFHFSKTFKKAVGISPREWRVKHPPRSRPL